MNNTIVYSIIILVIIIIVGVVFLFVTFCKNPNYNIVLVDAPETSKIVKKSDDWKIPKCIYQTQQFCKIPSGMKASMDNIIKMNPDFSYKYYNDIRARNFIKKHMPVRVLEAYDLLIPGAYKADLFRYCLLYIKGGFYFDSKFDGVTPLSNVFTKDDVFVSPLDSPLYKDRNSEKEIIQYSGIFNAFMASVPKHPILEDVIKLSVDRIHERDLGYGPLYTTGPIALGTVFLRRYNIKRLEEREYEPGVRLINHENSMVKTKDIVIFKTTYPGYREDVKLYNTTEHYGQLWNEKRVFKLSPVNVPPMFKYKSDCPRCIGKQHQFNIIENKETIEIPKFRPKKKRGSIQKIPYIIHQTNELDAIPINMKDAIDTIEELNPEYDIKYYNANDRRNFISKNFDKRTLNCYNSLVPGAYQADLFRYCVLYIEGGIYLDSGFECLKSLNKLLKDEEFIAAVDQMPSNVYTAFIGSIPKHPILEMAIKLLIERVENREYGENSLYPTGPGLLRDAFIKVVKDKIRVGNYKNIRLIKHSHNLDCDSGIIHDGSIEYFYTKYPGYRIDSKWYHPARNYADLWDERKIYK